PVPSRVLVRGVQDGMSEEVVGHCPSWSVSISLEAGCGVSVTRGIIAPFPTCSRLRQVYARLVDKLRPTIAELSVAEKLELIDQLWASLSQEPVAIPLTAAQVAELDARLDHMDAAAGV